MPPEAIVNALLMALISGALGALLWRRLDRLEAGLDDVRWQLSTTREQMALRTDLDSIREQMALRTDLDSIREQMARRSDIDRLRDELAVMRSDLTHVALAVGAGRPKPLEG
jgi:hypothetical protein